jgi:2-oxoglutarate dehydrogenase E1 component
MAFQAARTIEKADIAPFLSTLWKDIRRSVPDDFLKSPVTSVKEQVLREIGHKITLLPEGVRFFKKIIKLQDDRKAMLEGEGKLDWAMGELLAYGSLLLEGHPVRISGQDTQRGTFSHRHAVLTVEDSEDKFIPLDHISPGQAPFRIYNSLLSEYGVLGFEYGYAFASPDGLTVWEAQFGDFNNVTQVIIDQYLSSAEDKWKVMNGMVLYLPHGYEGQGPEHSSARLERFLTLSGHYNWQIVNCTSPANLFHVLRRQLHRDFRKPLVIFTPKSLLRHPRCVSAITEFTHGGFREVIDDTSADPEKITKLVFCSGKIYYDILTRLEESGTDHVALIRIEQLYPFPAKQISHIIKRYPSALHFEWVQEEPANMGALNYILQNLTGVKLNYVARPPSGSPATGSSQLHKIQQNLLVDKALGRCRCESAYGSCKLHCAEK